MKTWVRWYAFPMAGVLVLMVGCIDEPTAPSGLAVDGVTPSMAITYGPVLTFSTITELEPFEGAADATPAAVDRFGRVVGSSGGRAVIWEDGEPSDLGLPAGHSSPYFTNINDTGEMAIRALVGGTWRTYLWDEGDLVEITELQGDGYAIACVTSEREIVGTWSRSSPDSDDAFVWDNGGITFLPAPPGFDGTSAKACNSSGLVVGESYEGEGADTDEPSTFVIWQDGQIVQDDNGAGPFNDVWVGVAASEDAYVRNVDHGEYAMRWRDGTFALFPNDDPDPPRNIVAVSSGGLVLGFVDEPSGGWGVFRDDVFYPLDDGVVSHCSPHRRNDSPGGGWIADGAYVICEGPGRENPFVGRIDFESTPPGEMRVTDLSVANLSASSVTLTWTQINDGTGSPARYRLKYAAPPIDYKTATIGCERTIRGTEIGAPMSCTVEGLDARTAYEFQLMSFRVEDGVWVNAQYSNRAATTTGGDGRVTDLRAQSAGPTNINVEWTQIDDGTGNPARYRVKYSVPPIAYPTATRGCTIQGDEIGAPISCNVENLESGVYYDIQLMSYRVEDGVWVDAKESNVITARTSGTSPDGVVNNLRVASRDFDRETGTASLLLDWTPVDDGSGNPASYRLRYGSPLERWRDGTLGCNVAGTFFNPQACWVEGLMPGMTYEFQLMSYGVDEDGTWVNSRYSNEVSATAPTQ